MEKNKKCSWQRVPKYFQCFICVSNLELSEGRDTLSYCTSGIQLYYIHYIQLQGAPYFVHKIRISL